MILVAVLVGLVEGGIVVNLVVQSDKLLRYHARSAVKVQLVLDVSQVNMRSSSNGA